MNDYLKKIISDALQKLYPDLELPEIILEKPRIAEHGDMATNVAMTLAKPLRKAPRGIAEELVGALEYDAGQLESVEIAGPGFINFRFAASWLYDALNGALQQGSGFGKSTLLKGKRYQVEFVSANPTGPLTVGHGRNAVLGDTIARLYEWTGAAVEREYYFNNAGRQMRVLGNSVAVRYQQLLGRDMELPEGSYEGEYIVDIARQMTEEHGDAYIDQPDHILFKETAEKVIFADISKTLERMNIRMDTYFNENDLYENGAIDSVLQRLDQKGLTYKQDGALWFKTTLFGKEKDTVLVKSSGEPTYRLPDIAYHAHKLDRGYDVCVDIFGADHIATYPDVLSGLEVLGYDPKRIDVLVYQFVTIVMEGKPFKMSTRKANFVTLDELMDEVGSDVTRFFFLMRSPGTHLEFDIAQAKESGEKNPVFYLQYAYARIRSIMRKVEETLEDAGKADLSLLQHESEVALIKILLDFPEWVVSAAMSKEPHRLINYLNEVAAAFHKFYHDCRIIGEDPGLAVARVTLLKGVAVVMANGLGILGIDAPEKM
ncbi:MAG: arginyl-tRNA synthetase ArgS [Bacteroidetes bacterium HLUCCA01]|nr:MAG: arginyl-tRNA synthetase ArgS [Bacteroidetes bacterium HLUCCA01]